MKIDAFGARATLATGFGPAAMYRLDVLEKAGIAPGLARLPFSIKVLLEAVLRSVDAELVTEADVRNLGGWNAAAPRDVELPFMPARVILQDFTGVPAVVDLASMRAAVPVPTSFSAPAIVSRSPAQRYGYASGCATARRRRSAYRQKIRRIRPRLRRSRPIAAGI